MHYLLSVGLSFQVCREALAMLQDKKPWLFEEFIPKKKMRRLILISNASQEKYLTSAEFDQEAALEVLSQGQLVIPFWCDALLYETLRERRRLRVRPAVVTDSSCDRLVRVSHDRTLGSFF